MSAAHTLHAACLRVFGILFLLVGAGGAVFPKFATFAGVEPAAAAPPELAALLVLVGAFLAVPWWLPRGLRHPSARADWIWIGVLAVGAWAATGMVAPFVETLAPEVVVPPYAVPGAAVLLVLLAALAMVRATELQTRPDPSEADDIDEAEQIASEAASTRTVLGLHNATLAVAGIATLMTGAGILRLLQLDPELFARLGQPGPIGVVRALAVFAILAGVSLFVAQAMPRAVSRPSRPLHVLAVYGWLALLALPALLAFVAVPLGLPSMIGPGAYLAGLRTNLALLAVLPGITATAWIGLGALTVLLATTVGTIATSPRRARADAAQEAEAAPPRRVLPPVPRALRPRPWPVRLAVMAFRGVDWLVLRLLGAGLLGGAWVLWSTLQAERPAEETGLTWGQDPLHALALYAALGLVLAVPLLLPRTVLVPGNVVMGLVKATLIAGSAVLLMPALAPLAAFLPPDAVPPALLSEAPLALRVAAAFSVALAVLDGLVGQFGRKRRLDYAGRPIIELTPDELRQLRLSRMGWNA
jgi:hypothetical protein